jgi:hypothetical protein
MILGLNGFDHIKTLNGNYVRTGFDSPQVHYEERKMHMSPSGNWMLDTGMMVVAVLLYRHWRANK